MTHLHQFLLVPENWPYFNLENLETKEEPEKKRV